MNVLVILAHPGKGSFNHAIAGRVVETLSGNGHEVVLHDLYEEKFDPVLPYDEIPKDVSLPAQIQSHCKEVSEADGVVIVHPNHGLANRSSVDVRDFVGQSMIMHEQGSYFQDVIENLLEVNHVRVDMPITLSNNEAIKRAVAGGTGIAPISRKVADQEIDSGRLVALPLTDGPVFRKFSMIHHRDKYLSGPLERLIDMILEASREIAIHR